MTARAVGWNLPLHGAENWLKAVFALPYVALIKRSLSKGKAIFDYLTEDLTTLSPSVAFTEMAADLLKLANGKASRPLSEFERFLAEDLDEILLVRLSQLPSSRTLGDYPIESASEYLTRMPKDSADQKIIPLLSRPFPDELRDPQSPSEPPLRSDYAVFGWLVLILGLIALLLWRFLA